MGKLKMSRAATEFESIDMKACPTASCKLLQNSLVKIGSRSLTMLEGTPCNRTISRRYTEASHGAVLLLFTGMKWALLVSLSTTTQIPVLPFLDLGNPSIKSIETLSHFHCGTSNG